MFFQQNKSSGGGKKKKTRGQMGSQGQEWRKLASVVEWPQMEHGPRIQGLTI